MPALSVHNLWKSFDGKPALRGVSFDVQPGEILALLGPSGCGKSTILNLIAGLDQLDQGSISWQGAPLAGIPPQRRGFGLMFQDYALFPHLSVFENIAFGLRLSRMEPAQIRERVAEMLTLIGLVGLAARDVNTLSGGEAQRVALARSLAPQPRFLMLDEPLGALDRTLRERLVIDLRRILRQLHQTALYVTHDQEEAFSLADRVVLMNQGLVEQTGQPEELFQHPASPFAARFLGLDNLLAAQVTASSGGQAAQTAAGLIPLPTSASGTFTLLLRPDTFQPGEAGPAHLQGTLLERTFRGSLCRIHVQVEQAQLHFELPAITSLPEDGKAITLSYDPKDAVQIFLDH